MSAVAHRPINLIAREIEHDWRKPYFGAVPYLDVMHYLFSIEDRWGLDSADTIIRYFLVNANSWHGHTARRIKAELKAMLN